MRLLIGDLGGTNTRLALARADGVFEDQARFATGDLEAFWTGVRGFLGDRRPAAACLGVAGPVHHGRVSLTNVALELDERVLGDRLGAPFRLINDFHAQAAAIPRLAPDDRESIGGGAADPGAPIAVLGAGTGLGEALLVPRGDGTYRVLPTEGGHARFAPRDEREIELLRWLWRRFPAHVSVERVLSGPGLAAIYAFLGERGGRPGPSSPPPDILDPAEITDRALRRACPRCIEALEIFVGIYGDEAANLALKGNAGGGVFLSGGIAPRIGPALHAGFRRAFTAKGRFGSWLERLPVHVVTHPDPGLLGAFVEARALAG